jgi:WD40 repeat protein
MENLATQPAEARAGGDNQGVIPAIGPNAYVGPQPFPPDRQLYGRDRELLALTNRFLSERLLLLYSPSGAGKTSLIQAKGGLRHRMTAEGFHPLPVVRVSHAADVAAKAKVNRYWLSALVSLELARPESERRTPESLAQLLRPAGGGLLQSWLANHLAELTAPAAKGAHVQTFLVFDQFEELLTLDPTDDEAKREFLRQVGTALRDADRWALFAMREDHVAALDPFLPLLPSRLAATFRLDLLRREVAQEAIRGPSAEFGVTFEDDAITNLVSELARIQVQDPLTGKSQPKDGLYVEPLHLQLVCQRLWKERVAPNRITAEDLDRLAHDAAVDVRGVAAALAHYYDDSVRSAVAQFASQRVTERAIRNWFSGALISPTGLRLPVLLGNEAAYDLSPAVLRALADRYLVRSEQRHGGIYYELAHDRLVEPVQKSNAAWRKRLAPFQQAAEVWKESNKKNDLLVFDEVLAEGERLGELQELNKDDRTFLDACREAREARNAREAKKQAGRRKRAYIVGAVVTVAAVVALFGIQEFRGRALTAENETEKKVARAKEQAAKETAARMTNVKDAYAEYLSAWSMLADNPGASLGAAKKSLKLFHDNSPADVPEKLVTMLLPQAIANRAMETFGTDKGRKPECPDLDVRHHITAVSEIMFAGSKGQRLVTRDIDGIVLGWDDWTTQLPSRPCRRIPAVTQMMVTPGGRHLMVGHSYGRVCLWKMEDWKNEKDFESPDPVRDNPITSLHVGRSNEPSYAVVGYGDGTVQLFDWDENGRLAFVNKAWEVSKRPITTALLTPDSLQVVTNTRAGRVQSWVVGKPWPTDKQPPIGQALELKEITRVAVGGNGEMLAAVTEEGQVLIYRMAPVTTQIGAWRLVHPKTDSSSLNPRVINLAFSPTPVERDKGQTFLVFAAWDTGTSGLYRCDLLEGAGGSTKVEPLEFSQESRVTAVGFTRNGDRLAAGMDDGSTRVWWTNKLTETPLILRTATLNPLAEKSAPATLTSPVTAVLVGPEGRWAFTGQANGAVRRWDLDKQRNFEEIWERLKGVRGDLSQVRNIVDEFTK